MARESATLVLRHFQTLYARGVVGNLADGQLLHRFVDGGGLDREDAFAALVDRHGPMVLKVCRRMLPTPADAEDAFQAVFLVLARKAGSLREAETLKPWLYGVTVRTAQEARRRRPGGGRWRSGRRRHGRSPTSPSTGGTTRSSGCWTRRSPACPCATASRSSLASSRGPRARTRRSGSGSPRGRSPAGWPGAGRCCGIG